MRTGVVELSSTALRAVVAEPADGGWFRLSADQRVVLGLQRAVQRDGRLGEGLLQLSEETARRLGEAVFRAGADRVVGVVAASLGAAADVDELVARTERALHAPVRKRTAADEARCLVTAVERTVAGGHRRLLVVVDEHDLRVVLADRGRVELLVDLPGAGTRDLVPPGAVDPLHPAVRPAVERRVTAALAGLPRIPAVTWPVVLGRPVQALARMVLAQQRGDGSTEAAGAQLPLATLTSLERRLTVSTGTQRLLLPAVDPTEVDRVGVTAQLLRALVCHLDAAGVVVATPGVAEGQLLALSGVSRPHRHRQRHRRQAAGHR